MNYGPIYSTFLKKRDALNRNKCCFFLFPPSYPPLFKVTSSVLVMFLARPQILSHGQLLII